MSDQNKTPDFSTLAENLTQQQVNSHKFAFDLITIFSILGKNIGIKRARKAIRNTTRSKCSIDTGEGQEHRSTTIKLKV